MHNNKLIFILIGALFFGGSAYADPPTNTNHIKTDTETIQFDEIKKVAQTIREILQKCLITHIAIPLESDKPMEQHWIELKDDDQFNTFVETHRKLFQIIAEQEKELEKNIQSLQKYANNPSANDYKDLCIAMNNFYSFSGLLSKSQGYVYTYVLDITHNNKTSLRRRHNTLLQDPLIHRADTSISLLHPFTYAVLSSLTYAPPLDIQNYIKQLKNSGKNIPDKIPEQICQALVRCGITHIALPSKIDRPVKWINLNNLEEVQAFLKKNPERLPLKYIFEDDEMVLSELEKLTKPATRYANLRKAMDYLYSFSGLISKSVGYIQTYVFDTATPQSPIEINGIKDVPAISYQHCENSNYLRFHYVYHVHLTPMSQDAYVLHHDYGKAASVAPLSATQVKDSLKPLFDKLLELNITHIGIPASGSSEWVKTDNSVDLQSYIEKHIAPFKQLLFYDEIILRQLDAFIDEDAAETWMRTKEYKGLRKAMEYLYRISGLVTSSVGWGSTYQFDPTYTSKDHDVPDCGQLYTLHPLTWVVSAFTSTDHDRVQLRAYFVGVLEKTRQILLNKSTVLNKSTDMKKEIQEIFELISYFDPNFYDTHSLYTIGGFQSSDTLTPTKLPY